MASIDCIEKHLDEPEELRSNSICVSCKCEYSGSHHCYGCTKPCHSFEPCSIPGPEEGYGAMVLCSKCQADKAVNTETDDVVIDIPSDENQKAAKKRQSGITNFFQKVESNSKRPLSPSSTFIPSKKSRTRCDFQPPSKKPCICMTCFNSDKSMSPYDYYLCRNDKQTRERHLSKAHSGMESYLIQIIDATAPMAAEALNTYKHVCLKKIEITKEASATSQSKDGLLLPEKQKDKEKTPFDSLLLSEPNDKGKTFEETMTIGDQGRLEQKMDVVVTMLKNLCTKIEQPKVPTTPDMSILVNELTMHKDTQGSITGVDWSKMENIIQLTGKFKSIRFFASTEYCQKGCVRCQLCFEYLSSRDNHLKRHDPITIEEQGHSFASHIKKYGNNISSGLFLEDEVVSKIIEGKNDCWYRMKNRIKNHLGCTGDNAKTHLEALKAEHSQNKLNKRGLNVSKNLVRVALSVVESKCAAIHFETQVAAHIATGSDMGDIGHSYKQFNEILKAAEVYLDKEIEKYLLTPLSNTLLPPHFCGLADKSTIHRVTNQGVIVTTMLNGIKTAIVVQAPAVYHAFDDEEEDSGGVTGACAPELAETMFKTIMTAYPGLVNIIGTSWQGTVLDGQYQPKGFAKKLWDLLEKSRCMFTDVIWDPPHWVNLGVEDVIEGKIGQSQEFMKRLIARSTTIHQIFQRGKNLAQARTKAETMKCRLHLTSRTCATRFSTSQIHEFRKLISSVHVYMATYEESHQHDSKFELKKWEICGQDFVADLCGCVDVFMPVITYLVQLQGLSVPIWKASVWFPKVTADLNALVKLRVNSLPESCFHLSSNISDIKKYIFHGQKLVDGWLIVGEERSEILKWKMRQLNDVAKDLQNLATDLSVSLTSRFKKCASNLQSILGCIDVDCILKLLVGVRKPNGYPSLEKEEEFVEFGRQDFTQFFKYVCSLIHVKKLAENHFTELKLKCVYSDEILTNLKNALKIILWTPKHIQILCRWLKFITTTDNGQVKEQSLVTQQEHLVKLMEFSRIESSYFKDKYYLQNLYEATFLLDDQKKKTFLVWIDESEVYRSFYVDELVSEMIGVEMSIATDIALALGSTESVVESLYSVMKSQSMEGGQNNSTLALRTKIDWLMPTVIKADKLVNGIAQLYHDGDESHNLPRHRWPILSARAIYGPGKDWSKVMSRKTTEGVRLPFIL